MRILSARILRARRNRFAATVEAIVMLTVATGPDATVDVVRIAVAAPARAAGAAPLRHRLIAAAKLRHATSPRASQPRHHTARYAA